MVPRSSKTRQHILGLKNGLVGTKEGAKSLAKATREIFGSDIGLATTGEHDLPGKSAAGQTFLGIADSKGERVELVKLPGDYERVRQFSVISLLNALRLEIIKK